MSTKVYFLVGLAVVVVMGIAACDQTPQPTTSVAMCPYRLPWPNYLGEQTVTQGMQTSESHKPGNMEQYAIDFGLHDGDPVAAARAGRVSQVHDGETACGGQEAAKYANFVIIDHGDGTYALYTHLQKGIPVKVGQQVNQGDIIGYAGRTGYTVPLGATGCQPHLHFQIQERGDRFDWSVNKVCFAEVPGGVPQQDQKYVSQNPAILVLAPGEGQEPMAATIVPGQVEVAKPAPLDLTDPYSVIRWTIYAMESKDTAVFEDLVGPKGVRFTPLRDINEPSMDGRELVQAMDKVLREAQPVCLGYQTSLGILTQGGYFDFVYVGFRGVQLFPDEEGSGVMFALGRTDPSDPFELYDINSLEDYRIEFDQERLLPCSSLP